MTARFTGKTAIVTGAAGGIGQAICQKLATDGAAIVVCDIQLESAQKVAQKLIEDGHQAIVVAADISKKSDCERVVQATLENFSSIDLLANNAGINRRGDLLSLTDEDWLVSFDVNVHSMYYLTKAALPHMVEQGGGAIVNTASQWGLHPAPNHIAYNTTKAAVAAFTQNLARDYAPHNVRVNGICPGEVHTPMLEAGVKRAGKTVSDLDALVPFGRIGKPEEIANLVAFLLSDEAAFMCGSLVEITGAQAVA